VKSFIADDFNGKNPWYLSQFIYWVVVVAAIKIICCFISCIKLVDIWFLDMLTFVHHFVCYDFLFPVLILKFF